jgi:hypothetical protein
VASHEVDMSMQSFTEGERVEVHETAEGIALHALGTVDRIRSDGGAWVALDFRSKVSKAHPFPPDSARGTHVVAYPASCEPSQETAKERRAFARAQNRPDLTPANFGKDHWSTLLYLETRIVDHAGILDKRNMRCITKRHPLFAHGHDASAYPTKLKGNATIPNHDDWDCIEDLIEAGLVEWNGTGASPVFALTDLGWTVAGHCRRWRAEGHGVATFSDSFTTTASNWVFHLMKTATNVTP